MKNTILSRRDYSLLRKLEVLAALDTLGSSRAAAERLEIGAAAVSKHLSEIERNLGCSIFDRDGKALRVGQNGQTIAALGVSLLRHARREIQHIRNAAQADKVELRMGFVTPNIALATAKAMRIQQPDARFHMVVANSDDLKDMLDRQLLDLAFLALPKADARFTCHKVVDHHLCVLASKADTRFHDDQISVHALSGMPLIMREEGSFSRKATFALFRKEGLSPNIDFEVSGRETLIEAARCGFGIGTIMDAEAPNHPDLKAIKITESDACGSAYIAHHPGALDHPAIKKSIDMAIEIATKEATKSKLE